MNIKTITKILVIILGVCLITSAIVFQNTNNTNNSIKNSQTKNNSYDFYSKFGTETLLTKDYFIKSLKQQFNFTKIRIDSLPLHSFLNFNNTPIQVGQEINFDEITKVSFRSSIDQYDQFGWSGFVGSGYLPSVTMKAGVGGCGYIFNTVNMDKTTPFNTLYSLNSSLFENATTSQGAFCGLSGVFGGIKINSLPLSGLVTHSGGILINLGDTLTLAQLDTLIYSPNNNYSGADTFEWFACDLDYFINSNVYGCIYGTSNISSFNITVEPGAVMSSSAVSSLSSSSSLSLSLSSSSLVSLSSIAIAPQIVNTGGLIVITNTQPSSIASSSSSSQILTSTVQSSSPITPTVAIKIFDPKKLASNKIKPNFGTLSAIDDKAAIEDPYDCGGNIHGAIESNLDLSNLYVLVSIKGKYNYDLGVDFDRTTGLYTAKINYDLIKEGQYTINYKIVSENSNKALSEGSYTAFITKNCNSKAREVAQTNKLDQNVVLPRTGGSIFVNSSLIILVIVAILFLKASLKEDEQNNYNS